MTDAVKDLVIETLLAAYNDYAQTVRAAKSQGATRKQVRSTVVLKTPPGETRNNLLLIVDHIYHGERNGKKII